MVVVGAALVLEVGAHGPDRLAAVADLLPDLAAVGVGWPAGGSPWQPSVPPGERSAPLPGLEESDDRLDPLPDLVAPSPSHAFAQMRPGPGDEPVTWSPCRPLHYVVNVEGAPPGFADEVVMAMGRLASATGLRVVSDGLTTEMPTAERTAFQPDRYGDRWAPVLLAFSDETVVPDLAGDVVGVGGFSAYGVDGRVRAVSGSVVLDTEVLDDPPVHDAPAYVPVLLHEIGHLVGLAHVDDPTQLMYPTTGAVTTFQGGDLTGLAALGAGTCAPDL